MKNSETGGWRAFFKLDVPEKTNLLEMSCDLLTTRLRSPNAGSTNGGVESL